MIKFIFNLITKYSQFFKYCVGGGVAFIVDFSLLWLLTEKLGIWYLWSATFSFVISVCVNYFIQRYWTFNSKDKRKSRQVSLFFSAQIVGLFINNSTMYILVGKFGVYYLFAKAIAAGIVLIWNFWVNKVFIFNSNYTSDCPEIIIAGEIFPPDIGGPATYSYSLAKYLLSQGKKVHIICYSSILPASEDEEFGTNIQRVSSFLPLPVKYFIYFFKLCNVCLSARVIYAQGPVASGWPAVIASRLFHKKLVIKIVGDYNWEQSRCAGVTNKGIDDWQISQEYNTKNILLKFKLKLLRKIQSKSVHCADNIITPSNYLKNIVSGWGVSADKIKIIYNSFNPIKFKKISQFETKKKLGLNGDILLSVGRLANWKGIDMLIEIMPELKKINTNFKLVIAGNGPEKDKFKLLIKQFNLGQDVVLLGRLSRQDLANLYLSSSIFLLNTSYEGLSHILLEAMHYHLPIITTDIGGNTEIIQDEYNGLLVGYNHKEEWVKAVRRIWHNQQLRDRLCKEPVSNIPVFSFEAMITETMKILKTK